MQQIYRRTPMSKRCIFSEHVFLRTPLEGCFCSLHQCFEFESCIYLKTNSGKYCGMHITALSLPNRHPSKCDWSIKYAWQVGTFDWYKSQRKCLVCLNQKGLFIKDVHKIFLKTNISYPLIPTRTWAYQG